MAVMPEFHPESRRDRRYTIAICKGGGLVDETRRLITSWRPGEDVKTFVQRVLAEDLLGRHTAYRARDIARRVFARRFLIPSDRPARMLKRLVDRGLPRKTFTEMLFLFACRADSMLYDFTIQSYWEAVQRGRTHLTVADALAFFADARSRGYIPRPWSEHIEVRSARGLLGMLRDVGFLLGNRRDRQGREIVPYDMSDEGVACLARDLHDSGISDSSLSAHTDWRVFGLSCEHVYDRLDKLGEERGLLIQRAGSVVSITWRVKSMEDLIEDVTDQLRGIFGLHSDGTVLTLHQLAHLSEEQKVAAQALRELLDHFVAGAAGTQEERWRAAYERLVLEISFTILNRLVALRLCEERGLVIECVRKAMASDGFRLFERLSGGALGTRYQTYGLFLESLFDELAVDLGMLFDRTTPQSAIFPSDRCLEDVLALLNDENMASLWTQDETIGWVYQYFNPPEERRAMREKSPAPRNSRELAVRNQFFTPRYVVEFLTDNTFGRTWYEMRQGNTHLKEDCRYLVRRPNELFLDVGQRPPTPGSDDKDLSQEALFKQPLYISHREGARPARRSRI